MQGNYHHCPAVAQLQPSLGIRNQKVRDFHSGGLKVETIRVVCAHDCPDACSLLVKVENGQVTQVRGDPGHPFTAGFACAKTNRDAELVNSPERLATPMRRIGAKGEGKFAAIGWEEALQ